MYFNLVGGKPMPSFNSLISSIPRWEAASISIISIDLPLFISWHAEHLLQGSKPFLFSQLTAFAKSRAMVVLPVPLGP
ncbi:hypothetical protein AMJ49_02735 [Parcubacteria bacterium DG_74_2]|nr:MAG: hypothetical protein AMJ49_02735 [Parcubacteria bacterium DG_74_2]